MSPKAEVPDADTQKDMEISGDFRWGWQGDELVEAYQVSNCIFSTDEPFLFTQDTIQDSKDSFDLILISLDSRGNSAQQNLLWVGATAASEERRETRENDHTHFSEW